MTYDDIVEMLEEANLPLAYDHFAEGESPDPPFLIFLFPGSDNMYADNRVFQKIDNEASLIRLMGSVLIEQNSISQARKAIFSKESYQRLLKSDVRNHLHLIAEEQAALLAA